MGVDKSKILVLGRGFLGKTFEKNGYTVWGREKFESVDGVCLWYADFNNYDVVINTIGNADTRSCEESSIGDLWTNYKLPKELSELCGKNDIKFVHISTGCVYDKNNEPQCEDQPPSAHCNYVVSKILGEDGCDIGRDLIIRPRLFFGDFPDKNNLLTKIKGFDKFLTEINSFTSTQTIVEAVQALIDNSQVGVFNVAQTGYTNMYEIAKLLSIPNPKKLSAEKLVEEQNLNLVNNILDLSKLEEFYTPRPIYWEIIRCNGELEHK